VLWTFRGCTTFRTTIDTPAGIEVPITTASGNYSDLEAGTVSGYKSPPHTRHTPDTAVWFDISVQTEVLSPEAATGAEVCMGPAIPEVELPICKDAGCPNTPVGVDP